MNKDKVLFLFLSVLFLGTVSVFAGNIFVSEDGIQASYYSENGSAGLTQSFVCVDGSGENRTLIFENGLLVNVSGSVVNESNESGSSFPSSGLISYYSFDVGADDDYASNDGTVSGASLTTGSSGKLSEAYDFDGTDDYIDLPNTILTDMQSRTVSMWVYVDSSQDGRPLTTNRANDAVHFRIDSSDRLWAEVRKSDAPAEWIEIVSSSASTEINTGEWVHIGYTIDQSTKTISVFVNGTVVDSGTYGTYNIGETGDYATHLGGMYSFFNGKIDEIGVWNRALTTDELSDLYNSGDGLVYG